VKADARIARALLEVTEESDPRVVGDARVGIGEACELETYVRRETRHVEPSALGRHERGPHGLRTDRSDERRTPTPVHGRTRGGLRGISAHTRFVAGRGRA
jgi:hypothetical protein